MPYVYRHIRHDKNEPFYIGIGSDATYRRANEATRRNSYWSNIAKNGYDVDILFDDLSWETACEKEAEFILLYGRRDLGTGILANMTNGGEGLISPNKEIREKKRQSMLGKNTGDSNGMKQIEARLKVSNSRMGKYMGDEHPRHKKILCFNLNNEFICEYNSIMSAQRETGIANNNIVKVLKGKRKTAGGFIWKYNDLADL